MTKQKYFEKIIKCLNFKQTVDLLAISLNTQLPHFVSLTHFISFMKKPVILCFPAIHLYPQGFTKGLVPNWPNQLWYTEYTEISIKDFTLPSGPDLLILPSQTNIRHPMHQSLQLRAAIISGKQQQQPTNLKMLKFIASFMGS